MTTTSACIVLLDFDLIDAPAPCALCGEPYNDLQALRVSPFEAITLDGRPVCRACAEARRPDLLATVAARVAAWPHDVFAWPAVERERVRTAIQGA